MPRFGPTEPDPPSSRSHDGDPAAALGDVLAIVDSHEPERIGHVARLHRDGTSVVGRGDEEEGIVAWELQMPGETVPAPVPYLDGTGFSRRQIEIDRMIGDCFEVANVGSADVFVNGAKLDHGQRAIAGLGDTITIAKKHTFLLTQRPRVLPKLVGYPDIPRALGEPDALGIVGNSLPAIRTRIAIAINARLAVPVLICGESGTGKELIARALHDLSARKGKPFVVHNMAALDRGLAMTELFGISGKHTHGNQASSMGVVGAAEGGTLFLDEIGELSTELQAALLRVVEGGGFKRSGDDNILFPNIRIFAATNRHESELKGDFAGRLKAMIQTAPLMARREDIPFLVQHVARRLARESPEVAARFVHEARGALRLRMDFGFLTELVRRTYTRHTRELESLVIGAMTSALTRDQQETTLRVADLHQAMQRSQAARPEPLGAREDATPDAAVRPKPASATTPELPKKPLHVMTREELEAVLEAHQWHQGVTAKALGVHDSALARRMDKLGVPRKRKA